MFVDPCHLTVTSASHVTSKTGRGQMRPEVVLYSTIKASWSSLQMDENNFALSCGGVLCPLNLLPWLFVYTDI